jgi:hypothetical protein
MRKAYLPENWYWIVADSTTQVYSSLSGNYVSVDDPTYLDWIANDNVPTPIISAAELGEVLADYEVTTPVPAAILDGMKSRQVALLTRGVLLKILYNHENRIRTLEGQGTLTVPQFLGALKSLL